MTAPQEKAQSVSWFIETKSGLQTRRNFRSMEEIHVYQLVHGARNSQRQGQCSMKKRVHDQEHPRETSIV